MNTPVRSAAFTLGQDARACTQKKLSIEIKGHCQRGTASKQTAGLGTVATCWHKATIAFEAYTASWRSNMKQGRVDLPAPQVHAVKQSVAELLQSAHACPDTLLLRFFSAFASPLQRPLLHGAGFTHQERLRH